jgi:hypothetical protein
MNEEKNVLQIENLSFTDAELFNVVANYEISEMTCIANSMYNSSPDALEFQIPVIQIISIVWRDLDITKALSENERNQVERDFKMQNALNLEVLW